ncbi:hypothetical protein pb186bvf_006884 [Paramecium bursaria]
MQSNQGQVKIIGNYSYNLKHCLGEGAYGKVYQGVDTTNNVKVAIKKLDLRNFEKDQYLKQSITQEIEILKKFNHKNIVKFIDLISTQRSLYIITEFCKDGDLKELMSRKKFNELDTWKIMKQIIQGFKELVQNAITHRDLKPANIVSNDGIFKIADFGFAKYVDNFSNQLLRSCVGSPLYMAPQILARKPYTTKCDIWSLGVIFYEMVFADVPWKGRDERDLLKNILSVPLNYKKLQLTQKSEEFLKGSLTIEENDRISWDDVFKLFEIGTIPQLVTQTSNKAITDREKERKRSIFQRDERKQSPHSIPPMIPQFSQPTLLPAPMAQTPSVKNVRSEIIFRNFVVSCDLFPKYTSNRNSNNSLLTEKLLLCLSKTNIYMQTSLLGQANQGLVSQLRKESDQYIQFHIDLIEVLQRNGQLSHCERELDIINLKEPTINDADNDKMQQILPQLIKLYIQEQLEENRRNPSRQLILILDNLADIILNRRKTIKLLDIDYDQLNADKADEEDPKRFLETLVEKLRCL